MTKRRVLDSDGVEVRPGDTVRFSYGIPPVAVVARVIERDGKMIVLTPGHNPEESNLRSLKRHVGAFWKEDVPPTYGTRRQPRRTTSG